jgi:iron complex transport system substrate-binding protein
MESVSREEREERDGREARSKPDVESLATLAIDLGLRVHKSVGPGLLESAYEGILAYEFTKRGLMVERQKLVPILYDGVVIDNGFRADLIVEGQLLLELKSVANLVPAHRKQLLTYLRFLNLRIGLLMNFGGESFKDGLHRVVNKHSDTSTSPLRVNRSA